MFLGAARRKLRKRLGIGKKHRIGRFELVLSPDHRLDEYQHDYRLTDAALGELARLGAAKYPDFAVIDIGANVGDTAAMLCRYQDVPVLCIEGHPSFLALLRLNLARLPAGIEIAECVIGPAAGKIPLAQLRQHNGTASLRVDAAARPHHAWIPMRPLADVLEEHPRFARPRLIKTDTDGADFDILLSSLDVIRVSHPILHFEYVPNVRTDGIVRSIEVIAALQGAGYGEFIVYDNFGNLLETVTRDAVERFADLNRYLLSHALFGRKDIHYLDVCAFSPADRDLAEALRDLQRATVDAAMRAAGLETGK